MPHLCNAFLRCIEFPDEKESIQLVPESFAETAQLLKSYNRGHRDTIPCFGTFGVESEEFDCQSSQGESSNCLPS